MRRRTIITSAVGVTAAVAVAAVGTAEASQHPSAGRAPTRITVVERAVTDTVVDLGTKGDSRGDQLAFGNPVFDRSNTHRVGRDQGSCVRTVPGKAWECSFTTLLKRGSLVVEGPFYDTRDSVLAITGGTGAYARARGVMHLHALDAKGSAFRFRFVVRR